VTVRADEMRPFMVEAGFPHEGLRKTTFGISIGLWTGIRAVRRQRFSPP
jgi:hypothetical protein